MTCPVIWENIIEIVEGPIVEDGPTAKNICKYLTKHIHYTYNINTMG